MTKTMMLLVLALASPAAITTIVQAQPPQTAQPSQAAVPTPPPPASDWRAEKRKDAEAIADHRNAFFARIEERKKAETTEASKQAK